MDKSFAKTEQQVMTVTIDEEGNLVYLKTFEHDIFAELGEVVTARASHVFPTNWGYRQAFRLLRTIFGERGRVAEWTRCWQTEWLVDPSPVGAPSIDKTFQNRQDAIDFEIRYLNDWFLRR